MKVVLFGDKVADIQPDVERFPELQLVSQDPDAVICYGGDGTLLAAERQWPGVAKVPIRNSRHGKRCIQHPAPQVLERLVRGRLVRTEYCKLECMLLRGAGREPVRQVTAMNEVNVHMARINSALRFKIWINDDPYRGELEILGDGFVVSTPFGSTAYFNHITRGFFHAGIGIAFKSTSEHTNHVVVPQSAMVRILITRGPGVLTYDNSNEFLDLYERDEILAREHPHPAVLLTWGTMKYQSDAF